MSNPVLIAVTCGQCGTACEKKTGHVNRSKKNGANLFCGRVCFGLSRRNELTKDEKKAEKRKYDIEYRAKNLTTLKVKKAAYFQATRDPEKEKETRKQRMHLHVAYCQTPEYKTKKTEYDRKKVLERYGNFYESVILLEQVEKILVNQATRYERYVQRGYFKRSSIERRRELCRMSSMNLTLPS